jgi:cytochrome c
MNVCLMVLIATICVASGASAEAPQVLLQQYKCYLCHADFETKAGPAYIDVAARYRGNPEAVTVVAAMVRNGVRGNAPWHMPPHPEVSNADARTMARYILSLKK